MIIVMKPTSTKEDLAREHYDIENLWAEAELIQIPDLD